MNGIDYIVLAVILIIVGGAVFYIRKAKKSGRKCIGCPSNGGCSGQCGSCKCNCGQE